MKTKNKIRKKQSRDKSVIENFKRSHSDYAHEVLQQNYARVIELSVEDKEYFLNQTQRRNNNVIQ